MALNLIIPVAQLIGGIFANSMALISDAIHNFSDLAALMISYMALQISKKGASTRLTFGYHRAEIIGALANVTILMGAVIYILLEAISRLNHPEIVSGRIVMLMALVGICGNGLSAFLLYRDAQHNLNIKGAFLHMLGIFLPPWWCLSTAWFCSLSLVLAGFRAVLYHCGLYSQKQLVCDQGIRSHSDERNPPGT